MQFLKFRIPSVFFPIIWVRKIILYKKKHIIFVLQETIMRRKNMELSLLI